MTLFHGPNVVICKVVAGGKQTTIIGECLPTYTLEHLKYFKEALTRFRDQDPVVLGDLNSDIGKV